MCNDKSVNEQVKEGETAGIGLGCSSALGQGVIEFRMKKDVSEIKIKLDEGTSLTIEVDSTGLAATSRIISETLE